MRASEQFVLVMLVGVMLILGIARVTGISRYGAEPENQLTYDVRTNTTWTKVRVKKDQWKVSEETPGGVKICLGEYQERHGNGCRQVTNHWLGKSIPSLETSVQDYAKRQMGDKATVSQLAYLDNGELQLTLESPGQFSTLLDPIKIESP